MYDIYIWSSYGISAAALIGFFLWTWWRRAAPVILLVMMASSHPVAAMELKESDQQVFPPMLQMGLIPLEVLAVRVEAAKSILGLMSENEARMREAKRIVGSDLQDDLKKLSVSLAYCRRAYDDLEKTQKDESKVREHIKAFEKAQKGIELADIRNLQDPDGTRCYQKMQTAGFLAYQDLAGSLEKQLNVLGEKVCRPLQESLAKFDASDFSSLEDVVDKFINTLGTEHEIALKKGALLHVFHQCSERRDILEGRPSYIRVDKDKARIEYTAYSLWFQRQVNELLGIARTTLLSLKGAVDFCQNESFGISKRKVQENKRAAAAAASAVMAVAAAD